MIVRNFTSLVSLRYLKISKRDLFFSWISLLSITGVSIGVAAMIVVLSVINGFEEELRNRFLAANAHILAYRFPSGIDNFDIWANRVTQDFPDEVRGVSPFVHYETMAKIQTTIHSIMIRGIVPQRRRQVQSLDGLIEPATALDTLQRKAQQAVPPIILGKGLLALLGGKVGDRVQLISPQQLSGHQLFEVIGVYNSGLKHYDNRVGIVYLTTAQQFFAMGNRVTGIEIGLHSPNNSPKIARQMENKYALSIKEWQSFNRPLFEAMKQERVVISIIVALVALVAMFNIFTTLFVAVSQKLRDIAILRSLGATTGHIYSIFIKQGCFIGLLGCFFGVSIALIASAILRRYQIVDLPDLYLLAELPIKFDIVVYLAVCCVTVVCCLIAGLYPARIATRTSPLAASRNFYS